MPRLILAILAVLLWRDAIAAQYFVSKAGNDANSGLSGSPWLTIGKATSVATGGDSVTVSNGVYNEFVVLPTSGTPGNLITFQAVDANTIIDPSTDFSAGWVAAPEVGPLVYKQTGMPFVARYMSIDGSNIASVYTIGDVTAQIGNVFVGSGITNGTNCLNVPANATFLRDGVQCSYWDPLGALFIADGTTVYLRLRDGSNPNGHTIRANKNSNGAYTFQAVFAASAVAMSGRSNIVFQGFQIRNAFTAFFVLNSSANTIQSNLIVGTFSRAYVNGLGSSNNVFTGNTCIGQFYGNPGGNWEGGTSAVAENKHGTYVWGKYMMGESSTFDNPVYIYQAGSSNVVSYNTISSGLGANGVDLIGDIANPMYGTKVFGNSISYQSSVGVLDSFGHTYSEIFSNSFVDCDISIRPHELNTVGETTRTNFYYRNTSYLSGGLGNHIFCFAESSGGTYKPAISFYFNSFSGGNFAIQFNANTETSGCCQHMLFFNQILSGATAYFDGPPGFSTDANAVAAFDYSIVTPPSAGSTAWFGGHNIKTNNVWLNSPGMSFVLPPDSAAINSALDVSGTFTLNGQTYSGFPDGTPKTGSGWDMGALEKLPIWYLDITASPGGDGLSWSTAWKDFSNIVWASVSAGDTILISKGTYGIGPAATKSGTQASPITFKLSQAPGHVGTLITPGFSVSQQWLTFDGALDDTYTNLINSTIVVPQITNNIGWHVVATNTLNVDGGGTCINITGSATNGIVVRWLELKQLSDHQEDYGIRANYSGLMTQKFNDWGYLWIHNVGQDGIKNAAGSSVSDFDDTIIHHCLIELVGDDGVELNSGYTVHHCIIRNARDQIMRGHPDGISGQTWSWSKYYDNIIWGFKRSQCFYPNTLVQSNLNLYIYGNLVYWGDTNTAEAGKTVGSVGMEDLYWDPKYGHVPGSSDTNLYWQNVRIFNNTFAALPPFSTSPFDFFNRYKNGWTADTGKWCTVWTTNVAMANNSFYSGIGGAFGAANCIACDPTRMMLAFNNGYSTNTSGRSWQTEDGTWATAEIMDAANPTWIGNNSQAPIFTSPGPPNWDYRLQPSDTALHNNGTNLSAYLSDMPGLDIDLWGTTRGSGGTWDIGANELLELSTNLIVWLRFTNDFSINGGKLVDSSGTGHDFYRLAVVGTPYPSNFLTSISGTNYSGAFKGPAAMAQEYFLQPPDPRAAFETGTWAALTNIDAFTNMGQMTLACWVAADSSKNNFSAMVLDGGNDWYGCWGLGRWFSNPPTNNFSFRVATSFSSGNWNQTNFYFPNSQQLYANQWHHYAVTFNAGDISLYFDGTNCGSYDISSVITNLSIWPASQNEDTTQAYLPWIALGTRTHNGNPTIINWANVTDYPNNGPFTGGIGEVQIYNTALTAGQILAIYNNSQSGGGGGGGFQDRIARVTNLRVHNITISQ